MLRCVVSWVRETQAKREREREKEYFNSDSPRARSDPGASSNRVLLFCEDSKWSENIYSYNSYGVILC